MGDELLDITAALARADRPQPPRPSPKVHQSVKAEGVIAPIAPTPSTVTDWQTKPQRVRAWQHTGPMPITIHLTNGEPAGMLKGSWAILNDSDQPIEVTSNDDFKSRFDPWSPPYGSR